MAKAKNKVTCSGGDDRVRSHQPYGLDVDGYVAPLQGEPPIARTRGWGNLSFIYARGRGQGN